MLASGAGANARKSIGITVLTGMLASTCLAVLFVPSFFVVVQRFEEWRKTRKNRPAARITLNSTARGRAGPRGCGERSGLVNGGSHNLDAGLW